MVVVGALSNAAAIRNANKRKERHNEEPAEVPKKTFIQRRPTIQAASCIFKYQSQAAKLYKHTFTEFFVAGLIVTNFLTNMVEKTIDPDPDSRKYATLWIALEYFFNAAFTIELAINMYGFWFRRFWTSGWNVFDFVVVSIGLMTTFKVPLPGPFKLLRMMRAFRVFRLFKRVESLKKILESLARATPGVVNAFVILVLVMCIYAILAVEFFRTYGEGGEFLNEDGNVVALRTARDQDFGWEYFGNFPKALYTMFQVLTGESWAEVVARPLLHSNDALQSVCFAFFFVSFVVVNSIILINVVVAVLLEKMVDEEDDEPVLEGGDEIAKISPPPAKLLAADVAAAGEQVVKIQRQLAAVLVALEQPESADSWQPPHPGAYLATEPSDADPPVLMHAVVS